MKTTVSAFGLLAAALIGITGIHYVRASDTAADSGRPRPAATAEAVFAGGCFWCTESDFEKVDGVIDAVSGYTGGSMVNPSYDHVSAGGTGHVEAVKVIYDPARVSYAQLLQVFWRHVDPTDAGGQFVDRGSQYRSVIFYANDAERQAAEASKQELVAEKRFDRPIVTEILPLGPLLPGRGLPPGLLQEEPAALPLLPGRVRSRPVPGEGVGGRSEPCHGKSRTRGLGDCRGVYPSDRRATQAAVDPAAIQSHP